jgi:hypothetical protein
VSRQAKVAASKELTNRRRSRGRNRSRTRGWRKIADSEVAAAELRTAERALDGAFSKTASLEIDRCVAALEALIEHRQRRPSQ